jgi:Bacterial regulatory protein, Fis family
VPAFPAEVATALVNTQPTGKTVQLLDVLIAQMGARGAAVLVQDARDPQALQVFAASGVSMSRLVEVHARWPAVRGRVVSGHAHHAGDQYLAPIIGRGAFVGALYVDGLREAGAEIEVYHTVLAAAVELAQRPRVDLDEFAATAQERDVIRKQLVDALSRNEWNIARVARILGVTRRTIYLRLQRFGIDRMKVPKHLPSRARPR